MARCAVDGVMNALIRMAGREEAAKYAFALADRVVGGLREPTALPMLVAPEAKPEPAPPSKPPPKQSAMEAYIDVYATWLERTATDLAACQNRKHGSFR